MIYTRDNINYGNLFANAMAARARASARDAESMNRQGKIWSDAAKNIGGQVARYLATSDFGSEDEAKLEALKKERDQLMELQNQKVNAEEQMKGYVPQEASYQEALQGYNVGAQNIPASEEIYGTQAYDATKDPMYNQRVMDARFDKRTGLSKNSPTVYYLATKGLWR